MIDRAIVLWFPRPASFTGENVAELHVHGGVAVVDALLSALGRCPGHRLAEPGEFSRRAFRNGKLDLAEAEGLADLIDADTAAARRQAIWQMEGGLSQVYQAWAERLLRILAQSEAMLDFSDEPIPDNIAAAVQQETRALADAFRAALGAPAIGERLRDGLRVALVGTPNVGKSSLLNALAGRDVAIVTAEAGTTRDVIEVRLDLGGFPVVIADTAGLRETQNMVEREGIRRTELTAKAADVVVEVFDAAVSADPAAGEAPQLAALGDARRIRFCNKSDLRQTHGKLAAGDIAGSAKTGDGLSTLIERLTGLAKSAMEGEQPAITRARHRQALQNSLDALESALQAPAAELAAEDYRRAMFALGRVTGAVDVEDVLDRIFGAFCIGK